MLLHELDEDGSGLPTLTAPDPARNLLIADYTIALTSTIDTNLNQLLFHAKEHHGKSFALQTDLGKAFKAHRAAGGAGFPPPSAHRDAQAIAIDAHLTAFVITSGSILDNLAALTISIGGFGTPLVKADLRNLRALLPGSSDDKARSKVLLPAGTPGRDIQDRLLDAAAEGLSAGPPDWIDWLLDFRNTAVHRAARIQTVHIHDRTVSRVMPRDPGRTTIEAWRRDDGRDVDLSEDSRATVDGLTESISSSLKITALALVAAWAERRSDPSAIAQPAAQWPRLQALPARNFPGYEPDSIPSPAPGTNLFVHPALGKRLKAGQLFDGASDFWAEWVPDGNES